MDPNERRELVRDSGVHVPHSDKDWIECLETAKDTYNWAENSLVQVAKAKGGAAIAEWDRGNRLRGITVTHCYTSGLGQNIPRPPL